MDKDPAHLVKILSLNRELDCQAIIDLNSSSDALGKGLKTGGLVAMAALCTIVIPGVHFLSVPTGLLISPIIGLLVFVKSRGKIKSVEAKFQCLQCRAEIHHQKEQGKLPYFGSCSQCKVPYQIVEKPK